jgi:hypothetical protein
MPLRKIVKSTGAAVRGKSESGSEIGDRATLALLDSGDVIILPAYLGALQIDMEALLADLKKSRTRSLEEAATILEIIESLERDADNERAAK